ncbi:hypothetical protein ECZU24_59290 [Escherichia coli]|nr:hypothetical protein ECZU24_59290 [Escherichia coli]
MMLLSSYASPCLFTAMDRVTPQNDVSDAILQRLPETYSRFLSENFMEYQVREFINEKYTKAVNILKDNLKENYHVFYGVRLI